MMKNGEDYSVAVRKPDRTIEVKKDKYISFSDRHKWAKLPFIRGIFAFGESMILGMRALTFSASFFEDDDEEKPSKFELWLEKTFGENLEKVLITFSMVLAFAMAIVIFMWLPLFIAERINFAGHDNLKALFEGVIRIIIYHGAEHKCINCIEHGLPLTVDNVAVSSKEHKRCGTSFIFIVMIISILFFMVVRPEGVLLRFASRIILIPVIAGVSYEFLRIAGRSDNPIVNALSRPGMWMQGLTTKEPDDDQIEVAIEAVKAVFDWESYLGEKFPEGPDALGRELLIKAEKRNN